MIDNFMTVKEVSNALNLSTGHIRQLCIKGYMSGARKIGNTWIIPRESVLNYTPGKKGFAVVWDNRRKEQQDFKDTIKSAIAEAVQPPAPVEEKED